MSTLPIRNSFNRSRSSLVFVIFVIASCFLFACSRPVTDAENVGTAPESIGNAVDINSATSKELERIPHIGSELAERIVAYRETYGPFTRPEQLLLIRGISEKRFREIRPLVIAR